MMREPPPAPRRRASLVAWPWALLAAAVTVGAFLPALSAGFVNWDDDLNFLGNPHYRGFGARQLRWMLTTTHLGPWQPLSWLTLAADWRLHGVDPRGYHLTSLLFHAATAALLALLAAALLQARPPGAPRAQEPPRRWLGPAACLGALAWSLHPLRVESVAWVTERRDVVSGLLLVLAFLLYARTPRRPRAALGAFALSLLAKASGAPAPLALLALDVWPLRRLPADPRAWLAREHRAVLLEKIPWLLASLAVGAIALAGQRAAGALRPAAAFGPLERVGLTAQAVVFSLAKVAAPAGLSPLYELRDGFEPLGAAGLGAAALLLALTAALLLLARRPEGSAAGAAGRAWLVAWVVALLFLAPVSGLFPAGHQFAADRYTYLATMPLGVLAAALFSRPRARRAPVVAAGVAALALLGALSWRQCGVWRDSPSLWEQALRVDPDSARATLSLAAALVQAGRPSEAEAHYRRLAARSPASDDGRYGLAIAALLQGRVAEAEVLMNALAAESPGYAMGRYGLGVLARRRGRDAEARRHFEAALRLDPALAPARQALDALDAPR